jgi:hypothetical protein
MSNGVGPLRSIEEIRLDDVSLKDGAEQFSDLLRRDAELFTATAQVFMELQDVYGSADPLGIAEVLVEEQPQMAAKYSARDIELMAVLIFSSEIPRLSQYFDRLYRKFNDEYFAGRLPEYRVRVVFDLHAFANEPMYKGSVSSGLIRFQERCIYLRYSQTLSLEGTLIHEMAHAATDGDHDNEWLTEMRRLKSAGAPVPDWDLQ